MKPFPCIISCNTFRAEYILAPSGNTFLHVQRSDGTQLVIDDYYIEKEFPKIFIEDWKDQNEMPLSKGQFLKIFMDGIEACRNHLDNFTVELVSSPIT